MNNIKKFIREDLLWPHFDDQEIDHLIASGRLDNFAAGEVIITEGAVSDRMYFLLTGTLQATKKGSSPGKEFLLGRINAPDIFGEIAFCDRLPRSSSVRALSDATVWSVSRQALLNASHHDQKLVQKLDAEIQKITAARFRETSSKYTKSLERELKHVKTREEFGHIFIFTVILLGISTIAVQLLHTQLKWIDIYSQTFGWAAILIIFLPVTIYIYRHKLPFAYFGVSRINLRQSLIEGGIIGISIAALMTLVAYLYHSMTGGTNVHELFKLQYLSIKALQYAPHSVMQEFVARGVLLGALFRFYEGSKKFSIIVISSFIFALFHIFYGVAAFAVTFLAGLVFGYIYLRHKNIWGVSLVHVIIGQMALIIGLLGV